MNTNQQPELKCTDITNKYHHMAEVGGKTVPIKNFAMHLHADKKLQLLFDHSTQIHPQLNQMLFDLRQINS